MIGATLIKEANLEGQILALGLSCKTLGIRNLQKADIFQRMLV
jgi:hypothetical protein